MHIFDESEFSPELHEAAIKLNEFWTLFLDRKEIDGFYSFDEDDALDYFIRHPEKGARDYFNEFFSKTDLYDSDFLDLFEVPLENRKPHKMHELSLKIQQRKRAQRHAIHDEDLEDFEEHKFQYGLIVAKYLAFKRSEGRVFFDDVDESFLLRFVTMADQVLGDQNFSDFIDFIEADYGEETPEENTIISDKIDEVVWYLEEMGISSANRERILGVILDLEEGYRNIFRKAEKVDLQAGRKTEQAAFNHLLSVLRWSLGLIRRYQIEVKNNSLDSPPLSPEAASLLGSFETEDDLVLLCVTVLTHDVVEDGIWSKRGVMDCLKQHHFNEKERSELSRDIDILNAEKFANDNRDRGWSLARMKREYILNILKNGSSRAILTKLVDLFSNAKSKYPEAKAFEDEDREEFSNKFLGKELGYTFGVWLAYKSGVMSLFPDRVLTSIYVQNPFKRHFKVWEVIYQHLSDEIKELVENELEDDADGVWNQRLEKKRRNLTYRDYQMAA